MTNQTELVTGAAASAAATQSPAATIAAFAVTAGTIASKLNIGANLLQFSMGYSVYTKLMAVSPYSGPLAQYVCATVAGNMARQAVATTVLGVSLGTVANLAFAVATTVAVAKLAQIGYNHMMADKEEKPVSVSYFSLVKVAVVG